jgi:hypothetical protein
MTLSLLRAWRFPHTSHLSARLAFYHDYVRYATPGTIQLGRRFSCSSCDLGGIVRIPLSSPKVIGVANSRGERE